MDPLTRLLTQGAAGAGGAAAGEYIEDIFSTWLYTGTGSTQTITNGIDLSGEGGLVWMKSRSSAQSNVLCDNSRGTYTNGLSQQTLPVLESNTTSAQQTNVAQTLFTDTGFTTAYANTNAVTYASWTFRKAPGFFDVVTYTGDGATSRNISHNLGSAPGCILVKRTDSAAPWIVYHRSLSAGDVVFLNTTDAPVSIANAFSAGPTASVFSLGDYVSVNASGGTYVAYLFAHDAQVFGDAGDQSVIKCGGFTGAQGTEVTLGWEPQWILIRWADTAFGWSIYDAMRGMPVSTGSAQLQANTADAEASGPNVNIELTPTGFKLGSYWGATSHDYIYIAIRRGPMKTPTSGTEVFSAVAQSGGNFVTTGFPVDLTLYRSRGLSDQDWRSRLTGAQAFLQSTDNGAEASNTSPTGLYFDNNTGVRDNGLFSSAVNAIAHAFRRAPGFFDVVAYTGTGSARTVSHNLGVAPELMIVKGRSIAQSWTAYAASEGASKACWMETGNGFFSDSGSAWNNTAPTGSVFTVNGYSAVNGNSNTFIAYLFASCPGVSKVGSYTGTGTTLSIDCGFTAGSRLVLIKRTDSTGDWYVWDTARGIVSGNDPYLLLNSTAAEVTSTDYIDPLSTGFQISSTAPAAINANGGSFIYLAIA